LLLKDSYTLDAFALVFGVSFFWDWEVIMVWTKSISLDVANKLFDVIGVSFEQNELEGGYLAKHEHKILIRPTLTACCIAVLNDWVTIQHFRQL
jgi:hypothetical protein